MRNKIIKVNNKMQKNYSYELSMPMGKNFDPEFRPDLSPKEMLKLGIFGGKYMNDAKSEYPKDWFKNAKLSLKRDPKVNFFKVNASQPIKEWRKKGWISKYDPRGWFEWYCRYYMGRRIEKEDKRQIKRWRMIRRHIGQIIKNCRAHDIHCRPRQRQALLHWAYDPRNL